MYIQFSKSEISKHLPEKRPNIVFSNPDLLIIFEPIMRIIIWNEILNNLQSKLKESLVLWPTWLDFGETRKDSDKIFKDYSTIELSELPCVILNEETTTTHPLFYNPADNNVYLNLTFVNELKSAGAIDIWYDTTAPFGRY